MPTCQAPDSQQTARRTTVKANGISIQAGKFGKENRAPNYFQHGAVNRKSNECWGIRKQFQECCVYKRPLTVLNCKGFSHFNSFHFVTLRFVLANKELFKHFTNLFLFLYLELVEFLRVRMDIVDLFQAMLYSRILYN